MENNSTFNSYAGFTIGPIYEVLSSARKTKELWFVSYFFSWFMESIVDELSKNKDIFFISPYVGTSPVPPDTIGKYHDRFIIGSSLDKDELFNKINKATQGTLDYFVELIDSTVATANGWYIDGADKETVREILSWYIQRNFFVLDKSAIDETKVVKVINSYLDSMEENRTFETGINEKTCFVCKTLPAIIEADIWVKEPGKTESEQVEKDLCPLCFLKYHSLTNYAVLNKIGEDNKFKYPSVLDISATDLLTGEVKKELESKFKDEDYEFDDIVEVYKEVKGNTEEVNSFVKNHYFEYFVILQADGDNLGKVLDKFKNPYAVPQNFSEPLFRFADQAAKIIKQFKGWPVYIGGDDILAFTPVAFKDDNGKTKTIIDLAKELSKTYKNVLGENNPETTLSMGINISYYKFPLSRALKNAIEELNKAKDSGKNSLALLFTKHSGHQEEFKFRFNSTDITYFASLLSRTLAKEINFPHTLHHNLYRFKELIATVPDKCRLKAFFDNNFNEPIHSDLYSEGLEAVRDYFSSLMFDCSPEERLKCVEDILSKLAFIKFLRGEH